MKNPHGLQQFLRKQNREVSNRDGRAKQGYLLMVLFAALVLLGVMLMNPIPMP